MRNFLIVLIPLASLISCSSNQKQGDVVDITSKMDKTSDFVDLVLSITQKSESDSFFVYKAQGLYKGDTVGIQVGLRKGLKAGIANGEMKNMFANNGITLTGIGKQSDQLLKAMTTLYGIDSIKTEMRNDIMTFSCANLNEKDIDYNSGEYKFKIFMETDDDVPELFVNFDFTNNLVFLNEKDQEYREGVLKYLMKR